MIWQEDAAAGRAKDARPTIVFTTIDHPIMREWAAPGVDVEVFPSGLVLDKMDTPDVSVVVVVVGVEILLGLELGLALGFIGLDGFLDGEWGRGSGLGLGDGFLDGD